MLHRFQENIFDESRWVAIAIMQISRDQRHSGIIYREGGSLQFLHLAWHHRLTLDSPKTNCVLVFPKVLPERAEHVAAICRRVWNSNKRDIPYGFSPPHECFDPGTAQFLLGPTRHGLTCASFVLAVFDFARLPLVVYDSWPLDRDGDREWQEKILDALKSGATPEHIKAVRNDIGNVRYRPEEVVGAGALPSLPASFAEARQAALEVLRVLSGSTG